MLKQDVTNKLFEGFERTISCVANDIESDVKEDAGLDIQTRIDDISLGMRSCLGSAKKLLGLRYITNSVPRYSFCFFYWFLDGNLFFERELYPGWNALLTIDFMVKTYLNSI